MIGHMVRPARADNNARYDYLQKQNRPRRPARFDWQGIAA